MVYLEALYQRAFFTRRAPYQAYKREVSAFLFNIRHMHGVSLIWARSIYIEGEFSRSYWWYCATMPGAAISRAGWHSTGLWHVMLQEIVRSQDTASIYSSRWISLDDIHCLSTYHASTVSIDIGELYGSSLLSVILPYHYLVALIYWHQWYFRQVSIIFSWDYLYNVIRSYFIILDIELRRAWTVSGNIQVLASSYMDIIACHLLNRPLIHHGIFSISVASTIIIIRMPYRRMASYHYSLKKHFITAIHITVSSLHQAQWAGHMAWKIKHIQLSLASMYWFARYDLS